MRVKLHVHKLRQGHIHTHTHHTHTHAHTHREFSVVERFAVPLTIAALCRQTLLEHFIPKQRLAVDALHSENVDFSVIVITNMD